MSRRGGGRHCPAEAGGRADQGLSVLVLEGLQLRFVIGDLRLFLQGGSPCVHEGGLLSWGGLGAAGEGERRSSRQIHDPKFLFEFEHLVAGALDLLFLAFPGVAQRLEGQLDAFGFNLFSSQRVVDSWAVARDGGDALV